jgi:hypothetical protein
MVISIVVRGLTLFDLLKIVLGKETENSYVRKRVCFPISEL